VHALSQIIYVEHDRIASHVIRCNHDSNDGIDKFFLKEFDEIAGSGDDKDDGTLNAFMDMHGRKCGGQLC
jgi:hypothetical protein